MAYTKHTWVDNSTPAINATHLNEMEDGIHLGVPLEVTNVPASPVTQRWYYINSLAQFAIYDGTNWHYI